MMVRFRFFFFIFFLSTSLFVNCYKLPGSENVLDEILDGKEHQRELGNDLDLNENCEKDLRALDDENKIPKNDPLLEGNTKKWLNVLKFDLLTNLTEKDKDQNNDTKVIFINSEDHLKIYENIEDEDEETGIENHEGGRFSWFDPKSVLSRGDSSEEKGLERSKREADGEKKKCKCRRKGRRRVVRRRRRRRRMRRRRVGQARPARRRRRRRRGRRRGNRRRRGKRRCVCRKNGGGGEEGGEEGEGRGEEGGEDEGGEEEDPEVEEADDDEETTTTEGGGEEYVTEDGGDEEEDKDAEGEGDDYYDADLDEDEGSDEESDEKEEDSDDKEIEPMIQVPPPPPPPPQHEVPVYVMPYPGTQGTVVAAPNTVGAPMYTTQPIPFSPYPYYTPTVVQKARR